MNQQQRFVYDIANIVREDKELIGLQTLDLLDLVKSNIPLAQTFVVTTQGFDAFIEGNNLANDIVDQLSLLDGVEDKKNIRKISQKIQRLILENDIPRELAEQIKRSYKGFAGLSNTVMLLNPSCISEDLEVSMRLNEVQEDFVFGFEDLLKKLKYFWSELFSFQALEYREKIRYEGPLTMALLATKQPMAEVSMVVQTSSPLLQPGQIEIETILGHLPPLLEGRLVGDRYVYDVKKQEIIEKSLAEQKWMEVYKFSKSKFQLEKFKISDKWKNNQKLSDKQIHKAALISKAILRKYDSPVSIKMVLELGKVVVVDIDEKPSLNHLLDVNKSHLEKLKLRLENADNFNQKQKLKVEKNVENLPDAPVVEPAIKDKTIEEYIDEVEKVIEVPDKGPEPKKEIKTVAEVYSSDWDEDKYKKLSKNIEAMVALSGDKFVQQSGNDYEKLINDKDTTKRLVEYIDSIVSKTSKPVFYKFTSFCYRKDFNSVFGAARLIAGESMFNQEIAAIRIVRNKLGRKNLWLLVPSIRDEKEFSEVKKEIALAKLRRSPTFKIYAGIDNAVSPFLVEDLIEASSDGFVYDLDKIAQDSLGFFVPGESPLDGLYKLFEASRKTAGRRKAKFIAQSMYLGKTFDIEKLLKLGFTDFATGMDELMTLKTKISELEAKRLK